MGACQLRDGSDATLAMDDDGERALQEVPVIVLGSDGDLRGVNGVAVVR